VGVTTAPTRRMTLKEAADVLGISKEAVRKRVKRGSLSSDKGADGLVYVCLDAGGDTVGEREPSDALLSEMRSRIAFLEGELQRKDAILLNMTEAMKAITPSEASGEGASAPHEDTATEESAQGPWWRRWFGG
jgi:hypothetical protein